MAEEGIEVGGKESSKTGIETISENNPLTPA